MMYNTRKISALAGALVLCTLLAWAFVSARADNDGTPWIGVYTQAIDEDLQEAFDLDQTEGVVIVDVVDDSPADEAGLRRKDILVTFDGKKVDDGSTLVDLVRETEIGDKVELAYIRKGKKNTVTVEIGARPRSDYDDVFIWKGQKSPRTITRNFTRSIMFSDTYIGVGVQGLNEQLGEYFGVKDGEGVLVTEVFEDSPAAEAGLKAGDVITAIDGESVAEVNELQDIISDREEGDEVEVEFLRRGAKQTLKVEVAEDKFGRSAFGMPNFNIRIPNLRGFYGLDRDDLLDDYDDYLGEMREMKKELKEMQKELQDLRSKLE